MRDQALPLPTPSIPPHPGEFVLSLFPEGVCVPSGLNQLLLPQPVPPSPSWPPPPTGQTPLPNKSLGGSGHCHQGSQQHEGPHCQPKEPVSCPDGTPGPLKSHQDGGLQPGPPSCPLSQGRGKAPAGTGQGWAPQPHRPPPLCGIPGPGQTRPGNRPGPSVSHPLAG